MNDGTILLVEDNEDDVFALKRGLKKEDIPNPLRVVNDGQQAIDYLSGNGDYADREKYPLPFIVFLDLKLPFVNGFDVLTWMRTRPELGGTAVVVLTSSDETKDSRKAFSLGVRSYLVKPTSPEDIRTFLLSLRTWIRNPQSGPTVIKFSPQPVD
jgi:CheY-like chemotaxis protein